jgi:hypothetical protein
MSANVGENASPFVDQLADGPGVSRIDPTIRRHRCIGFSP